MTVAQLIAELEHWPSDLTVVTAEGLDIEQVDDFEDTRGTTDRPNQHVVVLS